MLSGSDLISFGGKTYIERDRLLAFLGERAKLALEGLRVKGTPPDETEHLRGRDLEIQVITDAISTPIQTP